MATSLVSKLGEFHGVLEPQIRCRGDTSKFAASPMQKELTREKKRENLSKFVTNDSFLAFDITSCFTIKG